MEISWLRQFALLVSHFICTYFQVIHACPRTLLYIVKNKQRPYVISIVLVYKSFTVLLGDQWSLNLPLFTVWSLSVQWTAFLFSTIVSHSLKHLSLKCLERQINCHWEFKSGNWEEKGHKGIQWIILHEMGRGEVLRETGRDEAFFAPAHFVMMGQSL